LHHAPSRLNHSRSPKWAGVVMQPRRKSGLNTSRSTGEDFACPHRIDFLAKAAKPAMLCILWFRWDPDHRQKPVSIFRLLPWEFIRWSFFCCIGTIMTHNTWPFSCSVLVNISRWPQHLRKFAWNDLQYDKRLLLWYWILILSDLNSCLIDKRAPWS
jgi:hypothetical protein